MNIKTKLILMNILQFAIWGTYLTSMSRYLGPIGMGSHIGLFYSVLGIVSIFMPTIIGIIADRWIQAQKLLGLCHLIAATFMIGLGIYGVNNNNVSFPIFFTLYTISVSFYMPTISLSYSVAYSLLENEGLDTIKTFPPIRLFGTVGFICAMWATDLLGFQKNTNQFILCGIIGIILSLYTTILPNCSTDKKYESKTFIEAFGLNAFRLFRNKKMLIFFLFSMLLGISLQITNGFANPFIASFEESKEYANSFVVQHPNILISLSQISEVLCLLLVPFLLKRFGIKVVMAISMIAWVLRFGLFGFGNPGEGLFLIILSMIVYGIAFDFFNISGSIFVNNSTDDSIRSSAQGLFMLMTNGIGATIGTLLAQEVINIYCSWKEVDISGKIESLLLGDWKSVWLIFSIYALIILVAFIIVFRYKHKKV